MNQKTFSDQLTVKNTVLGIQFLFGMIASIGIRSLVDAKTDMGETRNQVIVSVVLTVGIGGAIIQYGTLSLPELDWPRWWEFC